jgi:2,3-dihydroxyphenylpropionate 1,2-dioxygenase
MMGRVEIEADINQQIHASFERLAQHYKAFSPDIVVQFSPDHYQGFFHRLMPAFCLGLAAKSAEDWSIPAGEINVPKDAAEALMQWLFNDNFDIAVSRNMVVDHGFLQLWEEALGSFKVVPIIPLFVNCAAPPLPSYQRVRELGESVGRYALQTNKRVLIVASGGLSHDAPVPDINQVPNEIRDRLINGTPRSNDEKKVHESKLAEFGLQAAVGEGPCMPLNPEWDNAFLNIMASGKLEQLDSFHADEVKAVAGRAANEVLCWVAAFAALSAAGNYTMHREFYHPIPGWIAGMAMVTADVSVQ